MGRLSRLVWVGVLWLGCAAMAGCQQVGERAFAQMAQEPLPAVPWAYSGRIGRRIETAHYDVYTTVGDTLYQHMIARVLEAAHARAVAQVPGFERQEKLDCYVFASRGQWETYTRERAGVNAPIYLRISSGGYCQEGVFAGYDIGRDLTLGVIAHESWHQLSWFMFKDRLPSWLEEGMATQNEAIAWREAGERGAEPEFVPEDNWRRRSALRMALRTNNLWHLQDLLSTHAGLVIRQPQARIDAYYAELWSLVLFLEQSPVYGPRVKRLLADAAAGRLTRTLEGTGVTQHEIDNFTERWNTVAGPVYFKAYLNADMGAVETEYLTWARGFAR